MRNKTNHFRTSDIKLHKDSVGYYEATHPSHGTLFDSVYFDTRTEARRAAVEELQYAKENGQTRFSEY